LAVVAMFISVKMLRGAHRTTTQECLGQQRRAAESQRAKLACATVGFRRR
jgi:hypothetical protein